MSFMNTEMGAIAGMLDDQTEIETPLKRKLTSVGKVLTIIGIFVCILVFIIGAMYQKPLLPQYSKGNSILVSW